MYFKAHQSTLKSKDGIKKWFPRLVKAKTVVTTNKLAELIAEKSSLTTGDVKNVLDNLPKTMALFLMNSQSVNIEGLGSFTAVASAGGSGVNTEKEVNAKQINGLKIRFTPSYSRNAIEGTTRAMFAGVTFEKYDPKKLKDAVVNPGGGGNTDDDYVDPDA